MVHVTNNGHFQPRLSLITKKIVIVKYFILLILIELKSS